MTHPKFETRAELEARIMHRRAKQCETCPFRGCHEAYREECAAIPAEDWPCHSEGYFGQGTDVQCRGHYEARRKYARVTLAHSHLIGEK